MVKRMRSFFAVVMLVIAATVNAQVTTSSMSGKVVDQSNEAIIGATIQAIHEPSGTHYGAITNVDGRYSIQGMRAGGPYKVEVSYVVINQWFTRASISSWERITYWMRT